VIQAHINLLFGPEFLRSPGDQFLVILDYIADVIGQFSSPDRDKFPLFHHSDIGLGRLPSGGGGRGGPGGGTTDDQDSQLPGHKRYPPSATVQSRLTNILNWKFEFWISNLA
jgi:hypothetical protein